MLRDIEECISFGRAPARPQFLALVQHYYTIPENINGSADAYWTDYLDNCTRTLFPALTSSETPSSTINTASLVSRIPTTTITQYTNSLDISFQSLCWRAWAQLLSMYTGEPDVVFGGTLAGRFVDVPAIESIIGPCIHVFPIRIDTAKADMGQRTHRASIEMGHHTWLHLRDIVKQRQLFDTWVLFQQFTEEGNFKVVRNEDCFEGVICLEIFPGPQAPSFRLRAQSSIVPESHCDILLQQFEDILLSFLEKDVIIHSPLSVTNPQPSTPATGELMYTAVEKWAAETPKASAVEYLPALNTPTCKLTYEELNNRANCLAWALTETTRGIVPIYLEKSFETYIAILGILKAGCAYLPIEPGTPLDRIKFIIKDAEATMLVTTSTHRDMFPDIHVICLDQMEFRAMSNLNLEIIPTDMAYVLYTSGTTGTPKGVMLSHTNVIANLEALTTLYDWTPSSRILQFASYTFDVSVFETFFAFYNGLVLCATSTQTMLTDLKQSIRDLRPTHVDLTSTAAALVKWEDVTSIQSLIQTGEALTRRVVEAWQGCCVIDAYGPTETMNVGVVRVGVTPTTRVGNIGWGLTSCSVFVVAFAEKAIRPLPVGYIGELCIGGPQVGIGYLHRLELTAEKFVDSPFGRVTEPGTLRLGEISATVTRSHPYVEDAVTVVAARGEGGRQVLVSFAAIGLTGAGCRVVQVEEHSRQVVQSVMKETKMHLPYYMVPAAVIPITELPRGSAGKTDKRYLLKLYAEMDGRYLSAFESDESSADGDEEWTATELVLRTHVARLAKLDPTEIRRHASIFQLGLDSLSAIQLSTQLHKENLSLSMIDIMQHPFIDQMARLLDARPAQAVQKPSRDFITVFEPYRARLISSLNVPDAAIEAVYPCTPIQESLLFPAFRGLGTYLNHIVYELDQGIDLRRLEKAVKTVVGVHQILRTSFVRVDVPGHIFAQVVWKEACRWDVRPDMDVQTVMAQIESMTDISTHPPLSFTILPSKLILTLHHAMYDGRSQRLLLSDIESAYLGNVPVTRPQYSWAMQRILTRAEASSDAEGLWKEMLDGYAPVLFPDISVRTLKEEGTWVFGKCLELPLDVIEQRCRSMNATLQSVGLAAWAKLLGRYTGSDDIAFGVVLSGRSEGGDWNDVIGPCINTIPFRSPSMKAASNAAFVQDVQSRYMGLLPYQHTPLRMIQKWSGAEGVPLFDTLFVYEREQGGDVGIGLWKCEKVVAEVESAVAVDLIAKADGSLFIEISCKKSLMSENQLELCVAQLEATLVDLVSNPSAQLETLPSDMLSIINPHCQPYPVPENSFLHSCVEQQAASRGDTVAVVFAEDITDAGASSMELTFSQLNAYGNRIAHLLRSRGTQLEDMVPICIPRSLHLYASVLGVSKAGAACVPIDPEAPAARKSFMIRDTGARCVLTISSLVSELQHDLPHVQFIALDEVQTILEEHSTANPFVSGLSSSNLAYVLYTSGTTGKPKGVLVEHGNVVQSIIAFQHIIPFTSSSRFLQFASCAFDVFIFELFLSWSSGICICGAPKDVLLRDLELALRTLRVTHADLTPSVAALLKRANVLSLELLVTGGEALTQQVLKEWGVGGCIYNAYGPTEATIGCTMLPKVRMADKPGNIGAPFENVSAYVMSVNEPLRPVMKGAVGELCVGGPLIARGYLHQTELTSNKFVLWTHPSSGRVERLYKTGDLVRILPGDVLEYLGRGDQQVKMNGIRIEVDEISHVLQDALSDVRAAATVLKTSEQGKKHIVSFVVLEDSQKPDHCVVVGATDWTRGIVRQLLAEARKKLPVHMVPREILVINRLPLGPTGKLDIKTLLSLSETSSSLTMRRSDSGLGGEPGDDLTEQEKVIRQVVAKVANVPPERIGRSITIFELGIDSLSAISLSSALRNKGINLNVSEILRHPTVGAIAILLADQKSGSSHQKETEDMISRGRAYLERYEVAHKMSVMRELGLSAEDIQRCYPCSPLQEGMIAQYVQSGGKKYVNQFTFQLDAAWDAEQLRTAWMLVGARHDTMRTCFCGTERGDGYVQVVFSSLPESFWTLKECRNEAEMEDEILRYKQLVVATLVLTLHHALYDGSSLPLQLDDVQTAYRGAHLPDRPQFRACMEYISATDLPAAEAYWRRTLRECITQPFPDLIGQNDLPARDLMIEISSTMKLQDLDRSCRKLETTQLALGLVAWGKLLSYYLGENDVVFGHVVSGRTVPVPGIQDILGPCFNTIPCRVELGAQTTNHELLQQVQRATVDVLPYQHSSMRDIHKWAGFSDGRALFDTLFVYQRAIEHTSRDTNLWRAVGSEAPVDYPVSVEMVAGESDDLILRVAFRNNVMLEQQAMLLLKQLDAILADLVQQPDGDLNRLPGTLKEDPTLLSIANAKPTRFGNGQVQLLHTAFEIHARSAPTALALEWAVNITPSGANSRIWTYDALNREANKIAHLLISRNATGRIIPICISKSPLMYMAILGTLKAGAAYVPVDSELPMERKQFMIRDCAATFVLTDTKELAAFGDHVTVLSLTEEELVGQPDTNPEISISASDLAYVLYTSGTTGQPKGVMITHDSAVQCLQSFTVMIPWTPATRFLQFATCSFDVSIFEMFFAWTVGAALCSATKDTLLEDIELAVQALEITHMDLTPSLAVLMRREHVPTLCVLVTGGEALTRQVVNEWAGREDVCLYNAYGPTETTIGCTMFGRVEKTTKPSNIGQPLPTCAAYVVDTDLNPLPIGAIGELAIGGSHVARGYLNRTDLTAAKFVRMLADGNIEFVGRMDDQVKLNGIRIELGEISSVVAATPNVEDAVTLVLRRNGHARDQLVSFISTKAKQDGEVKLDPLTNAHNMYGAIQKSLLKLPLYMTPAYTFLVTRMPLGKTGKWSRPEQALRHILAQIAGIEPKMISKTSLIFEIGLDSINAIRISSMMRAQSMELSVSDIMRNPSIERMIATMEGRRDVPQPAVSESVIRTLEEYETRARGSVTQEHGLEASEIMAIYPCVPLQEGMIATYLKSNGELYLNHTVFELDASVDVRKLQKAWGTVIEHNDILRTSFVQVDDDRYVQAQVVHSKVWMPWTAKRLQGKSDLDNAVDEHIRSVTKRIRSSNRPPIEFGILESPNQTLLILSLHHALYDGWSWPLMMQDVQEAYHKGSVNPRPRFLELVKYIISRPEEESKNYWNRVLDGCVPSIFPEDLANPDGDAEGYHHTLVSDMSFGDLDAASKRMRVGVSALGQAAWGKLLAGYVGSCGVVFGHVVSGRTIPIPAAESIVGPAFNTIPCRVTLTGTNADLVHALHGDNIESITYQHTPLRSILKWRKNETALFDTLLVYQKVEMGEQRLWTVVGGRAKVDYAVSIEMEQEADRLVLRAACKLTVMSKQQLQLLLSQLDFILRDIVQRPAGDAQSYGDSIPRSFLSVSNPDFQIIQCDSRLHSGIETYAQQAPEQPALEVVGDKGGSCVMSYKSLNEQSNRLAHYLLTLGVMPDTVIPIRMERTKWMFVAILGVLKAGAAYVPVDVEAPLERKRFMVQDVEASVVVVSRTQTDLVDGDVQVVCVDEERVLEAYPTTNPNVNVQPSNLAYILYTSGTTGRPKGVMVEHRNVTQALASFRRLIPLPPKSRFLQFATYTFDVSIFEMFLSWSTGITVVTASKHLLLSDLEGCIRELNVTHMDLTPTVAAMVQRKKVPSVQVLVAGGEALTQRVLEEWQGCFLVNAYGPTEAAIGCTARRVTATSRTRDIGSVFPTCSAYVVNDEMEVAPRGSLGELCIGGGQVARGYLHRPDLTSAKFVTHVGLGRLYRTGDYVKMLHDGSLLFLGRRDDQVKLNGLRIELREISAAICAGTGGLDCVTLVLKHPRQTRDMIVSFVSCDQGGDCQVVRNGAKGTVERGWEMARRRLPGYMVPGTIVVVTGLPRGTTNKVDTKFLANLFTSMNVSDISSSTSTPIDDSREWTNIERTIQDALVDVSRLTREEVGRHTSLFHLGLDSISAIIVSGKLRREAVHLSVADILQNPTIEQMTRLLSQRSRMAVVDSERREDVRTVVRSKLGRVFVDVEVPERLAVDRNALVGVFPATPAQVYTVSGWVASGHRDFVATFAFVIRQSDVDIHRLRMSYRHLLERHSILRTTFLSTSNAEIPLVQVVFRDPIVDCTFEELDTDMHDAIVYQSISTERAKVPSFKVPPIGLRVLKFRDASVVLMSLHHALYDGWSLPLMQKELEIGYYQEGGKGQSGVAGDDKFVDFMDHIWNVRTEARDYWLSLLKGRVPTMFPRRNPCQSDGEPTGERTAVVLRSVLSRAMWYEDQCKKHGVTLHSVFLAAWSEICAEYMQTAVPIFGIYHSGRSIPVDSIESLVGPCINILPFVASKVKELEGVLLASWIQEQLSVQNSYSQIGVHEIVTGSTPLWNANVNFLKFPDNDDAGHGAAGLFEEFEVNVSSLDHHRTEQQHPAETVVSTLGTAAVVRVDMDIEIAVRGNSVDIGVFAARDMMNDKQAESLVEKICGIVVKILGGSRQDLTRGGACHLT
ncbi:hypothetical protein DFJ77DRAFT_506369 [Powellomyces hirtus]|nr:hypothetical protein DFJ77DRAFT_506369 [Powellomyces hirtus]